MFEQIILGTSILFQITAAFLAIRLIRITGRKKAWIFISTAIILMIFRRIIPLSQSIFHGTGMLSDQAAELVALATSIFMMIGVAWIGPIFSSIKTSEEKLRAKEDLLSDILAASPVGICFIEDNRLVFANNFMLEMFGYKSIKDYGEKKIDDIFASDKEYKNLVQLIPKSLNKQKTTARIDAKFKQKNGAVFDGHLEINFSDSLNLTKNAVLTISDITWRKQAENALAEETERLTVTLRSIGDGVICADVAGNVILLNKVAERLTGWTEKEAMGKPLDKIFYIINEQTRKQCENPMEKVLKTGGIVGLANHTVLVARDGQEYALADSGAPIRDKNSNIIGVVLVFQDVTEKQKMEQELLKLNKLESIGILAGGIAHDFNNLLMAILGNISLAKLSAAPGDKIFDRLGEAEKASLRAQDLTMQLLTFSKGGKPVKKTILIKKLVKEAAGFVLKGSNVRCEYSIDDDLWPVNADEGQISQVINNIIINADQAMPEGGTIWINMENTELDRKNNLPLQKGRYVKISVKDQGIGISNEHIHKIFDPYFTTKQTGSGLGLATCHSIIINHDGIITVDTAKQEKGTTFNIYLPASSKTVSTEKKEQKKPDTGEGRILVMDDEAIVREVVCGMLQSMGYEYEFASDGAEAIELYKKAAGNTEKSFDAVIMDLTIPGGMGGKEAIEKLLELDPDVKAIVSSGYSNDPVMAEFERYGFKDIVAKPYRIVELCKVLNKVIKGID